MNKLPKKFYINVKDIGTGLYDLASKHRLNDNGLSLTNQSYHYHYFNKEKGHFDKIESYILPGYPELTLQQLKDILEPNQMNKTIIGYKLLKDTPDAIKGTIIRADGNYVTKTGKNYYYDQEYIINNTEWFEPLYEEEFKVGDIVVVTEEIIGNLSKRGTIGKITGIDYNTKYQYEVDYSWCKSVRKATPQEVQQVQELKLGTHKVVFESYVNGCKIGCTYYSNEQINQARIALSLPNAKQLVFEDNTIITKVDIQKVQERLK